jgi:alkylation response protein AidB-like acyl-CoA dehydrogenase
VTKNESPWMNEELRTFRSTIRQFLAREFVPQQERWREQRRPDAEAWSAAGRVGMLLPDIPQAYGGGGGSFAHEAVVHEELARVDVRFGSIVQSIVGHYILDYGSDTQRRRWLPPMARGELVAAIAMSEPNAGSDVQAIRTVARRDGDEYVVSGSKTFVTNGALAGLVCIAVKTDPGAPGPNSMSMIVAETAHARGTYRVGRSLEKVGRHAQDTCELFFDEMRVPVANLLGPPEHRGFSQMMKQLPFERLCVGVGAVATMERAVELTARYAKERKAFGKPLIDLQNTRFKLAECKTEAHISRVFIDDCIRRCVAGQLDPVTAAMAKYWLTERQCRVLDECLQLHGGYGYMTEFPIARMWADARVERIYAGTNEIMKEVIGWSL